MTYTNRLIPQLSCPNGTDIPRYKRFFHLSNYLRSCSKDLQLEFKKSPHLQPLLKACKYKPHKAEFFRYLQQDWDRLHAPKIPRGYLNYIDAEKEKIEAAAAKDMQNFLYFSKQDISPETYTIRLLAAVYTGGRFPPGLSIDDALERMHKILGSSIDILHFSFNFTELKTIFFHPDGSRSTVWYRPEITWTDEFLLTGENGSMHGKSFIK